MLEILKVVFVSLVFLAGMVSVIAAIRILIDVINPGFDPIVYRVTQANTGNSATSYLRLYPTEDNWCIGVPDKCPVCGASDGETCDAIIHNV
jgi:hypothetical protein